jgi:hypothetical protein
MNKAGFTSRLFLTPPGRTLPLQSLHFIHQFRIAGAQKSRIMVIGGETIEVIAQARSLATSWKIGFKRWKRGSHPRNWAF